MKKLLLLSLLGSAVSAQAATSLELTPTSKLVTGKNTIYIKFVQDSVEPAIGYTSLIDFSTLPAGVTISRVENDRALLCDLVGTDKIKVAAASTTPLSSKAKDACEFDIDVPVSMSSGDIGYKFTNTDFAYTVGGVDVKKTVADKAGKLVVGSGSTPTPTTFKLLVDTPTNGTLVASGNKVTATPAADYYVSAWSGNNGADISACPKGSDADLTAKTCTFDLTKLTADATIGVTLTKKTSTPTPTPAVLKAGAGVTKNGNTFTIPALKPGQTVAWGIAPYGTGLSMNCPETATTCTVTGTQKAGTTATVYANVSTTPTPTAAKPVPAVGLLGLFGMLASLAGAAGMVLRRKK